MARVSICIPAYKPKHFEACLASAVAQTFIDSEIIVSDDCPTDEINQICLKFPGRVNYSRNPNPGARNNVLRLMSLAQGEYVKFLLDDDILHPFCIQYLVQAMQAAHAQNPRLVFSLRATIDVDNNMIGQMNMLNIKGPGLSVLPGPDCIALLAANCVNFIGEFTTVLFRREDIAVEGEYTLLDLPGTRMRGLEDVAAWINLSEKGSVLVHPETLSYFRIHSGTNSDPDTNKDFFHVVSEWDQIVRYARDRGYLSNDLLMRAYRSQLQLFRTWAPRYPLLNDRIAEIEYDLMGIAA